MGCNKDDNIKHNLNCIVVNDFTEYSVQEFKADFDRLRSANLPIIPVYIDSYGGEVYSLLAMVDMIESSDIPVATIALGKAMSCGSILLACGHPGLRFIGRNSTVMIHDVATISIGKIEELKADVGESERLNNIILEMLATKCGHRDKHYFKKFIEKKKHVNWFLNADEAKQHKLVDHIGLPVLDTQYHLDVKNNEQDEKALLRKKSKNRRKSRK